MHELIGILVTSCSRINLWENPWSLRHPRGVPSVNPSTLSHKSYTHLPPSSNVTALICLAEEIFWFGGLRGVLGSGCGLSSSSCGGILWDDGTQAIPLSTVGYHITFHKSRFINSSKVQRLAKRRGCLLSYSQAEPRKRINAT